jgi:hypothetical protein
VTAAERELLDRAVGILRRSVATRPPPAGTLHYGLFALSRLLEEIARSHGPTGVLTDGVDATALEIAHHIVDHGVQLPGAATAPDHHDMQVTAREPSHLDQFPWS